MTALFAFASVVIVGALIAVCIGAAERRPMVTAVGFYVIAVVLGMLAVDAATTLEPHPGLYVGAVGALLLGMGAHGRLGQEKD